MLVNIPDGERGGVRTFVRDGNTHRRVSRSTPTNHPILNRLGTLLSSPSDSILVWSATRRILFPLPPICHTLGGRPVIREIRRCEWPFDQEATGKLFIATCRTGRHPCIFKRFVYPSQRVLISFSLGSSSISEDSSCRTLKFAKVLARQSLLDSRRSLPREGDCWSFNVVFLWPTACNTARFVINYHGYIRVTCASNIRIW